MATIFKALEEVNNFLLKEAETGDIINGNGEYKFVFTPPARISGAIQKIECDVKVVSRYGENVINVSRELMSKSIALESCKWYIFKKEIPIDEYHPEYVKTPISDFPLSSMCKIFAEEGEWTLEIHKFATVTI